MLCLERFYVWKEEKKKNKEIKNVAMERMNERQVVKQDYK